MLDKCRNMYKVTFLYNVLYNKCELLILYILFNTYMPEEYVTFYDSTLKFNY